MTPTSFWIAAGSVGFFLASAATALATEPDRIRDHHARHTAEGIACADCHEQASASTSAGDRLLPGMDTCASCHDVESPSNCASCHTNPESAGMAVPAAPHVDRFSHAGHLGGDTSCERCHGTASLAEPVLPSMASCRSCHETASGLEDCRVCHSPSTALTPVSHTAAWRSLHGVESNTGEDGCESCHTQTDCQDCHAGDNVRPRSHGLNFTRGHALAARDHEEDCAVCHGEPDFCVSCHAAERIAPRDHFRADWIRLVQGGGAHALAARTDLESCVACHDTVDEDPLCAECHGGAR
jgi:hypothetical protein